MELENTSGNDLLENLRVYRLGAAFSFESREA